MPLHDIETDTEEPESMGQPDWGLLSFQGLVGVLHLAVTVFTKVGACGTAPPPPPPSPAESADDSREHNVSTVRAFHKEQGGRILTMGHGPYEGLRTIFNSLGELCIELGSFRERTFWEIKMEV